MDSGPGVEKNRTTEAMRGALASRWPAQTILAHGYAMATVCRGDIDPGYHDEFKIGVHALYPELQGRNDNFGAMVAWAWG